VRPDIVAPAGQIVRSATPRRLANAAAATILSIISEHKRRIFDVAHLPEKKVKTLL
jgi:hypothetical protein